MQPLTLIFVGPQGSGKGTQITKLKDVLATKFPTTKLVSVQTGDLFRALLAKGETFAEKKVAESLSRGELQPDFLTNVLWGREMLTQLDDQSNLLIDGFPRTVVQANVLQEAFTFFARTKIQIINLDTPEAIVKERMRGRGRADDTPESIEKRLQGYREDTLPVLDFYQKQSDAMVHNIDGSQSIEEVHQAILAVLELS